MYNHATWCACAFIDSKPQPLVPPTSKGAITKGLERSLLPATNFHPNGCRIAGVLICRLTSSWWNLLINMPARQVSFFFRRSTRTLQRSPRFVDAGDEPRARLLQHFPKGVGQNWCRLMGLCLHTDRKSHAMFDAQRPFHANWSLKIRRWFQL